MAGIMTWRGMTPDPREGIETVHDADTVYLTTDQGDAWRHVRKCRLQDVYAPELKDPGGPECRQFVLDWVHRWELSGLKWPFSVDTVTNTKYWDVKTLDRYVCVVWNADRTQQLNSTIQKFITDNKYGSGIGRR